MSELHKARVNEEIDRRYTPRNIRRIAMELDSPEDANDVAQTLRDASASKSAMPVIWDLRRPYRFFMLLAGLSATAIATVLAAVILSQEQMVGIKLYAALAVIGMATAVGAWAAARARGIRREDERHAPLIDSAQVEEAAAFVRVFGPVSAFDSAGMLLLALAGGIDAALCGWIIGSGLAASAPMVAVFVSATLFAAVFVAVLRWVVSKFVARCGSIRAKNWVRRLSRMDLERFPEKREELVYVRGKLSPLTDDDFAKPSVMDYASAAGLLLLVPALFGSLIAFRLVVNYDGSSDLTVVLVSALCAVIGSLAAVLAAMSHLLREEGLAKTALARRFPRAAAFEEWHAAHVRECRRWANEVSRRINAALKQAQHDGDHRWARSGITVPQPFPSRMAETVYGANAPANGPISPAATGKMTPRRSKEAA